jgi:hypothetical protein
MRALLLLAILSGCTVQIVGPKIIYCPPLDSALARAKRDSFPSPLYCPLIPPVDSSKAKP